MVMDFNETNPNMTQEKVDKDNSKNIGLLMQEFSMNNHICLIWSDDEEEKENTSELLVTEMDHSLVELRLEKSAMDRQFPEPVAA